jgi:hypothetical protein
MSKPVSPRPLRKVAAICAYSQDDPPLRNPIIGIAVCCARAASGYATAAPPSSAMNWRQRGWNCAHHPEGQDFPSLAEVTRGQLGQDGRYRHRRNEAERALQKIRNRSMPPSPLALP